MQSRSASARGCRWHRRFVSRPTGGGSSCGGCTQRTLLAFGSFGRRPSATGTERSSATPTVCFHHPGIAGQSCRHLGALQAPDEPLRMPATFSRQDRRDCDRRTAQRGCARPSTAGWRSASGDHRQPARFRSAVSKSASLWSPGRSAVIREFDDHVATLTRSRLMPEVGSRMAAT
jgi:hypothetical protein